MEWSMVKLYNGTDPLNPDTDDDGLTDGEENLMATDPSTQTAMQMA